MLNLKKTYSPKSIIRNNAKSLNLTEEFSSNFITMNVNNTLGSNNSIDFTSYSPLTIRIEGIGDSGASSYYIKYKAGAANFLSTSYNSNDRGWTTLNNSQTLSLSANNYLAFVITNEGLGAATRTVLIFNNTTNELLTTFTANIIGVV